MLLGVHKHGLDVRDVAPSVSFFKGVRVGRRRGADVHRVGRRGHDRRPADPPARRGRPRQRRRTRSTRRPAVTDLDVVAWRADDELTAPGHRRTRIPARAVQHRKHLGRSTDQRGSQNDHHRRPSSDEVVARARRGRPWCGPASTLQIIDLHGNQAVDTLFYAARRPPTACATAPRPPSPRSATSS